MINHWLTVYPGGGGSTVNSERGQQSTVRVIDDQQSTVRGSTVNSEVIDNQQSTVRGSMVNSEAIDNQVNSERVNGQWWGWSMINTWHCWLLIPWGGESTVHSERVNGSTVVEVIDDQQSTVRGSMVNSEVIDDQHCWHLTVDPGGGEDQQSTVRGVNSQQWGNRRSTVNSERVNSQQWGDQWSTVRGVDSQQ